IEANNIAAHPALQLKEQELSMAKQNIKVQRRGLLPELNIGYFNQQIDGLKGFSGIQGGISIPLWFVPEKQKTSAAKIHVRQIESELKYLQQHYKNEYNKVYNQYLSLIERLNYFSTSALPNANELQRNANLLYQKGEIGYIEYIQGIEQAIEIKINYIETLQKTKTTESYLLFLTR
ncbi:MAG: TolC family protein, partial [Prolixibacteraceae bacterium]|nr:TolC family protein [Prolixibacteraceae bacterium]